MKIAEGTFQGLHPTEEALFREVLKGMKGLGVEIGCLDGYSSAVILDASELHLTSIDPFIPDSMEKTLIGSKEKYLANVAPYGNRAELIEDYSHKVTGYFGYDIFEYDAITRLPSVQKPTVELDFLFIDGDHTYAAVWQDYHDYAPRLKPGGILAIHDARMNRPGGANYHPGPSRVADEFIFGSADRWEIIGEAHSLVIAKQL